MFGRRRQATGRLGRRWAPPSGSTGETLLPAARRARYLTAPAKAAHKGLQVQRLAGQTPQGPPPMSASRSPARLPLWPRLVITVLVRLAARYPAAAGWGAVLGLSLPGYPPGPGRGPP